MTKRRTPRSRSKSLASRNLHHETLEKRELLAFDLVSVSADVTQQFNLDSVTRLDEAPRELTFRFGGDMVFDTAALSGFTFTASGGDGTFGDGNESVVELGHLGQGDNSRIIVARFAGDLADDSYRINVPEDSSGTLNTTVDFDLELGPRVVAVVPQPVTGPSGSRTQLANTVEVYFNNDPLSRVSAGAITYAVGDADPPVLPVVDPTNYRLFATGGTVETTDDSEVAVIGVQYDPVANKATLTFATDLESTGPKDAYRLRIGSGQDQAVAPTQVSVNETTAAANTFATAFDANIDFTSGAGLQSHVLVGGEIRTDGSYVLPWPGSYQNSGVRDQRRDSKFTRNSDSTIGINVYPYNFGNLVGRDAGGQLVDNAITPAQKDRIREVLDLYEENLGVRFVETADSGLQFATGDLRAVLQTADVSAGDGTPMSLYRINEQDPSKGVLVLDAAENFFDGYGLSPDARPSYFVEAIRGVGNVLGIGDLFELPTGTDGAVGSQDEPNSEVFSNDGDGSGLTVAGFPATQAEPDFLSHAAKVIGQAVNRPESDDVDFYSFSIAGSGDESAGVVSIETYAQRLEEASLLDSAIRLYRVVDSPSGTTYELVSRNDDAFGDDSQLRIELAAGDYVVGVSSTGNEDYYGEKANDTATGGRTEGRYDLRITFDSRTATGSAASSGLTDTDGTPLDGDADGTPGGDFNFWFRAATDRLTSPRTIFVDPAASGGNGMLATPFNRIADALAAAEAGDIVRLLPSAGADGDLADDSDNVAYNIGRGGPNNAVLRDGESFNVPAGVTVMIDAGAILKFSDSKIVAGSESVDQNRSLAAVQILGTPANSVVLTSLSDQSVGQDEFPDINTTPLAADWGGIEFRDDVDLAEGLDVFQNEGIFIDFVSHADIRFGGGRIRPTDAPTAAITIGDARPTIIYNSVTRSAGAAITATPNAFREDTFNAPRYQRFSNDPAIGDFYTFTSDYDRVGPEIVGNNLTGNAINGLSIVIDTPTAGVTRTMTVSGRFDDTDIVHIIDDSLTVSGNPGGAILLEDRPDVESVTGTVRTAGSLAAGSYRYIVTFVTLEGQESLPSLPTRPFTSGGAIELRNLPPAPEGFVGRRIYRADAGVPEQVYELVDQIDRTSGRFTDTAINDRGGKLLSIVIPMLDGGTPVTTDDVELLTTPLDENGVPILDANGDPITGTLVGGQGYDYRFTFTDQFGAESQASDSTQTVFALQDGVIQINNIPAPPLRDGSAAIFTGTNVYRRNTVSGAYERIAELRQGETSIIDNGALPALATTFLGSTLGLDGQRSSKLLPRYDARLTVDPGSVVKLDTSKIEVTFGADLYAEGTSGAPIVFTSTADDTVGGINFGTNADGNSAGVAGQWGGISVRQSSSASFDYVTLRYGGGSAVAEGALRDSNVLEILQADVRITNSRLTDNADGFDDSLPVGETRLGRGFNAPATIFIRGSQPIIVDNVIDRGQGAAISINPDSFTSDANVDRGRSTGAIDRFNGRLDNQGPLIAGNQIANHGLNGLDVRGEIVTLDSVWDDTDITHIVQSPIHSLTNAYGGALRLRSGSDASLVVKFGPNGTLNADGRPLDIDDRIGGTLQILGSPGFPVVLTSLNDDTIGGGFTPDGTPNTDTVGPPVLDAAGNPLGPAPGDWIGLRIGSFANDRNVAFRYETELPIAADQSGNERPQESQPLGILAARENASDENERLGFNVRGLLSSPSDVDVYSFTAAGDTEVVLDIDDTSAGLDTVVQLVTLGGRVIASSDNSRAESVGLDAIFVDESLPEGIVGEDAQPLITTVTSTNVESPNAADAGLKIRLPGDSLVDREYYVLVKSADTVTRGQYTLSVRIGDGNEIAGSNIRRADIRYAATAIDVVAAPLHSPLAGEVAEAVNVIDPTPEDGNSGDESTREVVDLRLNQNFAGAVQPLGNLLTSDRGSLVVTGEIGNLNNSLTANVEYNSLLDERLEDVDIYRVDLFSQQLEPDAFDSENRYVTTTFDIDYADQLGRADTRLSVFNAAGQLILVGHDSSVADDSARPVEGVDSTNLSGGSSGTSDAYIGPVELLEGTYFVAVSNAAVVPQSLDQFFAESPADPLTRLMPINSTRRISRDSFEEFTFTGIPGLVTGLGTQFLDYTAEDAYIVPNFDADSPVAYSLDDITLFVSYDGSIDGNDSKSLAAFNPFTGVMTRLIGDSQSPVSDIAIRRDGNLFSYTLGPNNGQQNSGNTGNFHNISGTNAAVLSGPDDGIVFRSNNDAGTGTAADGGAQLLIRGMAFVPFNGQTPESIEDIPDGERLFVVGARDNGGQGNEVTPGGTGGIPSSLTTNILYLAAASNGQITSLGSLDGDADRDFGNGPYQIGFGPAADEIEVGVVDTGQIDASLGKDGGDLTGIAQRTDINGFTTGELVGVTDAGGIHVFTPFSISSAPVGSEAEGYNRVIETDFYGLLPIDPEHDAPIDFNTGLPVLQFSGLSYAPLAIEDGEYLDTYFATTTDGWLYAFRLEQNVATSEFAVVPAPVFFDGQSAVNLTFGSIFGFNNEVGQSPNGLAFSTLQVNPFHLNSDRFADPGHGLVTPHDRSRQPTSLGGGTALYFGFDLENGVGDNTLSTGDGGGRVLSPGGLHGSAISDSIDLSDYSAGDRPTLYFTYYIDVEEGANNVDVRDPERDSFRVFGSGEDGQYRLLATNDEFRNIQFDDSFDEFNRVPTRDLDTTPNFEAGIPVQDVFDTGGSDWRQARVDLSPFAGDRDVKLRFDFSSAGARLEQIGSIELVGRDAEVLPDNDLVLLVNENSQGAALQTIVGRDIVFAAGSNFNDGDSLTITHADGDPTIVQFVLTDAAAAALPAGTVGVVLDPGANADQVARAVAAALPTNLAPRFDGGGRLSLLRAASVVVDDDIAAGQSNPVRFNDPGSPLLVTPSAQAAVDGETFTVNLFGFGTFAEQTFTYKRLGNETGDANEIVFDDSVTDPDASDVAIATEASRVINDVFQNIGFESVSFPIGGNVQFNRTATVLTVTAGPTELVRRVIADPLVRAEFSPGVETNDDETIRLTNNAGDVYVIVLDDDTDTPPGLLPAGATEINVPFTNTNTAEQIRDSVIAAVNAADPSLSATAANNQLGQPVAVTFAAQAFALAQRPNPFASTSVDAVRIEFPLARDIMDGETITIQTPTGTVEVLFNDAAGASAAGTVVYRSRDVGADTSVVQLVNDFIDVALEGNFEIGRSGGSLIFYGIDQSNVTFSNPNTNFTFFNVNGRRINIPSGDQMNDRDTIQAIATDPTSDAANQDLLTFIDEGANAPADDFGEIGFLPADSATDVRDSLAPLYRFDVQTTGTGGQIQLLIPGNDLLTTTPPVSVDTLRFEPFVEVDLPSIVPTGRGLRTGETITLSVPGGLTGTLVFVRAGSTFSAPFGQIVVPFSETSTAVELGLDIANRVNQIDPAFVAVGTPTGFGLAVEGADAVPSFDPSATGVDVSDPLTTYSIPITVPRGELINDGETLTIFRRDRPYEQVGEVYTFTTNPAAAVVGDNQVFFASTDSAADLANRLFAELASDLRVQLAPGSNRTLLLSNASSIVVSNFGSTPPIVSFQAAVNTTLEPGDFFNDARTIRATPVLIDQTQDSTEVAQSLQIALADAIGSLASDPEPDDGFFGTTPDPARQSATRASAVNYKIEAGDRVRLYNVTVPEAGSYGLNTFLPRDEDGTGLPISFSPGSRSQFAGQDNQVEGLYIDDIIVGFAERGETVLSAGTGANFTLNPEYTPDTRSSGLNRIARNTDQPENPDQILVGQYSLEIRTADSYGVPQDYDPINLALDETTGSGRTFDTNDRLSDGATTIILPSGADLIDGDRFVLSDGARIQTFEFNSSFDASPSDVRVDSGSIAIDYSPSDTAAEIAGKTRDAINDQQFSSVISPSGLRVRAASGDGTEAGPTTSKRVELFGENIFINPAFDVLGNGQLGDSGRIIKIDAVEQETPFGDFTSQRIAVVDQDTRQVAYLNLGDQLAAATVTDYVPGDTLLVDGKIGDKVEKGIANNVSADDGQILPSDPTTDVDAFRIYLTAGAMIDIDVDTTGLFRDSTRLVAPVVTVVSSGTLYANTPNFGQNTEAISSLLSVGSGVGETAGGAQLTFEAPVAGYYDVMVSSRFAFQGGTFATNPDFDPFAPFDPNVPFFDPADVGFGEYQMTIQPTQAVPGLPPTTGVSPVGVPVRDVLFVDYHFGITDANRVDDQGQILIENNIIRDSQNFAIDASIGARGQTLASTGLDNVTRPGAARLLRNPNTSALVPGTVIVNNLIIDNVAAEGAADDAGATAIRFAGGSFADGEVPSPNVFGRIINNTIIGDGDGTGIDIGGRSAPSIINNVVVDTAAGINVNTVTAGQTVAASNVFAGVVTPTNISLGSTSLVLTTSTGLFSTETNAGERVFIPSATGPLVDSSLETLRDRLDFANTVKAPVNIAPSPVLAPRFDALGNRRVDSPGVGDGGTGGNVFVDRGALEQADSRRPTARLSSPLDAVGSIVAFGDTEPAPAVVRLGTVQPMPFIEVALADQGVGIDLDTVTAGAVTLLENGQALVRGRDYTFSFSPSGTTIRLTSSRGEFRGDATYEVVLNQGIRDLAGNRLAATTSLGQTVLTIITAGVSVDFGDAPDSYGTQSSSGGPAHSSPTSGSVILGSRVDTEFDGLPSVGADSDDQAAPINFDVTAAPSLSVTTTGVQTEVTVNPVPNLGEVLNVTFGGTTYTIEFSDPSRNTAIGRTVIDVDASSTTQSVAAQLTSVLESFLAEGSNGIAIVESTADDTVIVESFDDEDGVLMGRITRSGRDYFVFGKPEANGTILDVNVDGILVTGQSTIMNVIATGNGFLDAWIDFNGDGTFGAQDRIASSLPVTTGDNLVTINTPAGLTTPIDTYARFRVSSAGDLQPTGVAAGGEVEDYLVSIATTDFGLPINTAPTFDVQSLIVTAVESDDVNVQTIASFVTNLLPGSPNKAVESSSQTIASVAVSNIVGTPGLLVPGSLSILNPGSGGVTTGDLNFATNVDLFGQITFDVVATDSLGLSSSPINVTIIVQPINDPPRIKSPLGFTASAQRNPDDAYSVATNGVITYTLKEDNTGPMGAVGGPFFIPINTGTAIGYNRVGLLSVFEAGPSNETAAGVTGGNQVVNFVEAGNAPMAPETARRTDRGGLLTPVNDSGGNLIGYDYQPPADFNTDIAGVDSFLYSVVDDNPLGGESYDPDLDAIVSFPLTTSNRVELVLNPVNDRPVFSVSTLDIPVSEDSALIEIENYATSIAAGPVDTAFDEVSTATGQMVEFTVVSLDFPQADSDDFFTVYPNIDEESGLLSFQPAANIFGDYRFEVTLNDDGSANSTRGDLISSIPVIMTISVSPINDPPQLDPNADPLQFEISEDGEAVILVSGTATENGLLDVFTPGPSIGRTNESADIAPALGGNQSVSLRTPITNRSAEGGTIEFDTSGASPQLVYRPRPNFVGTDTFVYSVRDDGQSVDENGVAFDDFRISSNTVTIVVAPVNDAPLFSGGGDVTTLEQSTLLDSTIPNWASNVQAGPTTAIDETSEAGNTPAQGLEFIFNQIEGDSGLFATNPTAPIDPATNTASLTYQTTPYANGVAVFEVFLKDDGPGSETGANDPDGDKFRSEPIRTFTINVQSVNDPPQATITSPTVTVSEDQGPITVQQFDPFGPGPAEATDEQDQTVTFDVQALAPGFARLFSVQPTVDDDGMLKFTTAPNLNSVISGPVPVVVTARDSGGTDDGGIDSTMFTFNIVITEVDDAPQAVTRIANTDEDSVLTLTTADFITNDNDPDLATNPSEVLELNLRPVFASSNGAEVRYDEATGTITYDPTNRLISPALQALMNDGTMAETLVDSFTYSLVDSSGLRSNFATVEITVSGINDAPILQADTPTLNTSGTTIITPLANDIDIDGTIDPLSIQITLQPAFGSLDVQDDGSIIYTPFGSFSEEDVFRYTVADNFGLRSEPQLITIAANASPIAVDDAQGTFVDETVFIDVAENDSDPNGSLDLDGITIVRTPLHGEAIPQSDGTVQYTPDFGFVGFDTFEYQIADDEGRLSNAATSRIQVVASRLQNPNRFSDVNADGFVTAIDALLIVNRLERAGSSSIPVISSDRGPNYFDSDGNQSISAFDALQVINELSRINNVQSADREQVFASGFDTGIESRLASVSTDSDASVSMESNVDRKLVDVSSPSSQIDDAIDSIVSDSTKKDHASETSVVDEVLAGLF